MFVSETKQLAKDLDSINLKFTGYVYNPLDYAWENHKKYLDEYFLPSSKILFLGMNPGPFGMMQNGVPFGEVNFVKNYLKINEKVGQPPKMHPKRQVLGLDYPRSEVSGKRVWTFVSKYFSNPKDFFSKYSIMNYCPLGFVDSGKTGKNITPDKLCKADRLEINRYCDLYTEKVITNNNFTHLIGIGRYAEKKLEEIANKINYSGTIGYILHPSPMNPMANQGSWGESAKAQLIELGAWDEN